MNRAADLILSVFTYLLGGYLAGLIIGFTVFDPDTDMYALLSLVLALIGGLLGLLPRFRAHVPVAFGALIGLYVGMVLAIILWGDPDTDDLLEMLERGGASIILTLACAVLGGLAGARLPVRHIGLPALALLVGGFLGGAVFVMLDIAPSSSMVGVAPYVLGSGIVLAALVWRLGRRPAKP